VRFGAWTAGAAIAIAIGVVVALDPAGCRSKAKDEERASSGERKEKPAAADAAAAPRAGAAVAPEDTPLPGEPSVTRDLADAALSFEPDAPPIDAGLERMVGAVRVLDVLSTSRPAEKKKRGRQKLVDFVRELAVAPSEHGKLQLRKVDCGGHPGHLCVAVVGDPCAVGVPANADCEGFYLTVIVDLSHKPPILDRALAGGGPVKSLEEIAKSVEEAP
jgi:hypothetical protein